MFSLVKIALSNLADDDIGDSSFKINTFKCLTKDCDNPFKTDIDLIEGIGNEVLFASILITTIIVLLVFYLNRYVRYFTKLNLIFSFYLFF